MSKYLFLFFVLLSSYGSYSQDHFRHSIRCEVDNGKFRIWNGSGAILEKNYLSNVTPQLVSCKKNTAVGIMGNYFVYSDGATIQDKYVGISSGETELEIVSGGNCGGAIIGANFLAAMDGKILQQYVGHYSGEERSPIVAGNKIVGAMIGPRFVVAMDGKIEQQYVGHYPSEERSAIAVGNKVVGAMIGPYFLVAMDGKILQQYVGHYPSEERSAIVVGNKIIGAMIGPYFLAAMDGKIETKYIGASGSSEIQARGELIAGIMGSYFVVVDGVQKQIKSEYIGSNAGRLFIDRDTAIVRTSSRDYVYSLRTHDFN